MNYELAKERYKSYYAANREVVLAKKKAWQAANPEKLKETRRRTHLKTKLQILTHYGGKCACCGEANFQFLCIDHKNDDGYKQRGDKLRAGTQSFYYWIKKNGYPDDLQVLCYNCNMGKAIYKVCPHQSTTSLH